MLGNSAFTQQGATNRREGATSLLSLLKKKPATPAPVAPIAPAPIKTTTSTKTVAQPKPTTKTVTSGLLPTTQTNTQVNTAPKIDTISNAQRVIQTGQQTPLEQTATEKIYQSGQATPLEKAYIDRVIEATKMQNAGRLGQYAEAPLYAGQSPEQQFKGLIEAPDLAARGVANAGLYNTLGDIYGSAATQGLLAANTIAGRGLTSAQSGLLGAQNIATRAQEGAGTVLNAGLPQYPSYGSQIINPLTGQAMSGTSVGIQDAVNNVVQRLLSGQMTYADATEALSGYGQGGLNALNQALPSNFSVAQSNILAGQQGSIKPAYDYATSAINTLENTLNDLGGLQKTNIPLVNLGANWVSQMFGANSEATRAYKGAVADARGAIQAVLAATKGGTPTDYVSQSNALLPDEPTPNDIAGARKILEELGGARLDIYKNPALSGSSTQSGGGFAEVWD